LEGDLMPLNFGGLLEVMVEETYYLTVIRD
jgi:hypothetical protein